MKDVSWPRGLVVALLAAVWFAGCYAEGGGTAALGGRGRGRLGVDGGAPTSTPDSGPLPPSDTGAFSALCLPAKSSESLPARGIAMDANATAQPEAVFPSYLYSRFVVLCGGCHVSASSGGLQVNQGTFKTLVDSNTETFVGRMTSDDPDKLMPPTRGKIYADLPPGDPVHEFAEKLKLWIEKGKPPVFYIDPTPSQAGGSQYLMSPDLGKALTNIGSCIPDKHVVGIEKTEMQRLDAMFEAVKSFKDLPRTLDGTDMVSFDAEKLARYGVIAFAPAYPLFSDHAKKMRYVRTPAGTSIAFDPKTKEFDIPNNTRFYKTFLKHVIDEDGNESYRKMETRLVLARPNTVLGPEAGPAAGTTKVNAIFATWKWKDERSAELVSTAYVDGTGFADDLEPYETDEPKAAAINADSSIKNKEFELRNQGVVRTYGIPGSDRCLQCHMGSPARSGVLGFTPLQVDRRKTGEGGTYEETGPDELTQLQRLIDYGVITGMTGPGKDVALETSQALPPRNDQELSAQGYMVGNCGFCHNPRGYPTVQNPELRDKLNFWPSEGGGIFHFPLDRTSPRIHRGDALSTDIPYITPSLYDLPRSALKDAKQVDQYSQNAGSATLPNWYLAPWRSLIYRNTDTPFTYTDDNAIFPHMPMNVPGYDCRVPRIMADWMISIPARWKQQKHNDDLAQDGSEALVLESCPTTASTDQKVCAGAGCEEAPCGRRNLPLLDKFGGVTGYFANLPDTEPQPYEEVLPTDSDYETAKADAEARLTRYHADERYKYYCPDDQAGSDIVDNSIPEHPRDPVPQDDTWFDLQDGKPAFQWIADGVPDRAHWVITDITQPVQDWEPRRFDWKKVLFDEDIGDRPTDTLEAGMKWDRLVPVVHMLSAKNPNPPRLTAAFRTFATTPRPMSVWTKTDCTFSDQGQPKVSSISPKPDWFTAPGTEPLSPDARVYMQAPGSFVFTQVCSNCHGRLADSNGRLASKILELTGGDARVASFRDGLFGPVSQPDKYRKAIFDQEAAKSPTDSFLDGDDLASRYMAFMGLGGTTKVIPQSLLSVVGLTPVFGTPRENGRATDANMLSIARLLCSETLPFRNASELATFDVKTGRFSVDFPSLQEQNGDGQLWREMCNFGNPSPVRALELHPSQQIKVVFSPSSAFYSRAAFTASDPVGDLHGNVKLGITDADLQPWCLKLEDETPATLAAAETWWEANRKDANQVLPKCPPASVLAAHAFDAGTAADGPDWIAWVDRAAANAGFAVFAYLDDMTEGKTQPPDPFNGCPSAAK